MIPRVIPSRTKTDHRRNRNHRLRCRAGFKAGADSVVITSRSAVKATRTAKEIGDSVEGRTRVVGFPCEVYHVETVNALWDRVKDAGIEVDVLVLNATNAGPPGVHPDTKLVTFFEPFMDAVRNQLVHIDRFRAQGPDKGKVLLYASSNSSHIHELPMSYMGSSASRLAMNRMCSNLATNVPASELQILSIHPGFVLTEESKRHGFTAGFLGPAFDDESLPANFYVWAATKKAAFLHGRFVWANWDFDELVAMRAKIEADTGFLRMGLQGVESQDFPKLLAGMGRAV